jgi:hypothetical protein
VSIIRKDLLKWETRTTGEGHVLHENIRPRSSPDIWQRDGITNIRFHTPMDVQTLHCSCRYSWHANTTFALTNKHLTGVWHVDISSDTKEQTPHLERLDLVLQKGNAAVIPVSPVHWCSLVLSYINCSIRVKAYGNTNNN